MLFSRLALPASLAAVASLAAPLEKLSQGESVIPRSPSAEQKLDAMRRWNEKVLAASENVASKYPVDHISNISDYSLWDHFQDSGSLPEPVRGKTGSKIVGPTDHGIDRQNPDTFAPPNTDSGTVPQAKWPFSLSHNRLQNGGWARQQNVDVLPVATELAGVQMHLEKDAIRELHWHTAGEWAYVLNGTFRVGIIDADGRNYLNDVKQGDLWFFPSGLPHFIAATSEGGGEFLLVFTEGSFSEDDTFLLSDFVSHVPREVLLKNFPGFDNEDLDTVPAEELYIFPMSDPITNHTLEQENITSPAGGTPVQYTFNASDYPAAQLPGGSVKIVDSRNFSISDIALAEVTINPGAMRELHWHPSSDEWSYFISGHARITVWSGTNNARTFDFWPGDVAYIPKSQGHYIEALGSEPVKYLETFKEKIYSDVSLSNWLAITPPSVVKSHLGFTDRQIKKLQQFKTHDHQVVQGDNDGSGRPVKSKRGLENGGLYGGRQMWA